jgi:hypothetical protein
MTMARRIGLILVLLSGGLSVWWGCAIGWKAYGGPLDFQAVYYGARTLMEHHNPYSVSELGAVYSAEGGNSASVTPKQRYDVTMFVNTPATLVLVAPFAMLPVAVGQVLWMLLVTGSLILAAYLVWDLAADHAPILSGCMVGFLLLNCQVIFGAGNSAAIVVGFCAIAVWCFLKDRYVPAGIVCMAISLAMKPHDAGLVWLFFLLAGGLYRKRAIQTAVVTAAIVLAAVVWISLVVPHWMHDWQGNMATISAPGGLNDPRPDMVKKIAAGNVISLQAVFSVFHSEPRFYNSASYLVCGVLLAIWAYATLRSRGFQERTWFALAVVVPLTVLVTYHRVYDAKLLLLTIPACAILWEEGGSIAWIALVLNAVGIFLHADVPLTLLGDFMDKLHLSTSTLTGRILTVVLERPNQGILLAMSLFYLWVYVRRSASQRASGAGDTDAQTVSENPILEASALQTVVTGG